MNHPLDGLLVIELGTVLTAPLAGMMLADLGARVVKVEHPNGGDPFRRHAGKLYSPHFASYNRNKESIQLDLQAASASGAKLIVPPHEVCEKAARQFWESKGDILIAGEREWPAFLRQLDREGSDYRQ